MKLGGWGRLFVLAAVAWFIGGSYGQYLIVEDSYWDSVKGLFYACEVANKIAVQVSDCYLEAQRNQNIQIFVKEFFTGILLYVFLPIPFVLGAIHVVLYIYRWVKAGFAKSETP